ncbi:hypothetical protein LCGC14_0446780 [marine sediment metagenome]|uniref:HNH nuclease domain-containing protein n=1 Tax=marine sediment metagenome TaxID=412755 RepID=A0A0F9T265_9ZZZZ
MTRRLSHKELNTIRESPCGRCGNRPPFPDGSRCHPHRIIPGCDGGQYVVGNVIPRCSDCHVLEHGGDGQASLLTVACRLGGLRGGPKAKGKVGFALWPREKIQAAAKKVSHEARARAGRLGGRARIAASTPMQLSITGRKGGKAVHKYHPNLARANGLKYGRKKKS